MPESNMTPAPKGFSFATASAGFKTPGRQDMALAVSETPAEACGVFTTNLFKAAPVLVAQDILAASGRVRAVLVNTGQANACTGEEGLANCRETLELVGRVAGLNPAEILPASTGVIGAQLKMDLWRAAAPQLGENIGRMNVQDFARAIMTTDSFPKYAHARIDRGGESVTVTGVAKGAGMICPNMATTLAMVFCDAEVSPDDWRNILLRAVQLTFNCVTVDGDTSTNDCILALANGASGVKAGPDLLPALEAAVTEVLWKLAYMLVQDGEGATKVIHIAVKGALNDKDAEQSARTVGHSQLVKTAMYGKDANWGRIVAALGRSGVSFAPDAVTVSLGGIEIFREGRPVPESGTDALEAALADALRERDVKMDISLGSGPGSYTLLASDLTHEYVSINADYRS